MAAAVVVSALPEALGGPGAPQAASACAPINFLYGHLHHAIRAELDALSSWALCLEADNDADLHARLTHLKERYHFLEQVYKYHSAVEDEVRGETGVGRRRACGRRSGLAHAARLLLQCHLLLCTALPPRSCTLRWTPRSRT